MLGGDIIVRRISYTTTVIAWRGVIGLGDTKQHAPNTVVRDGETRTIRLSRSSARIQDVRVSWNVHRGRNVFGRVTLSAD